MKRHPSCRFTIEQEQQIIQKYLDGSSTHMLSKEYSCDSSTIGNILKANQVPRRSLSEARNNFTGIVVNEQAFENISTPEQAYWLGVMYTDGYISKANKYTNYFGISVMKKDKDWLKQFQSFLKTNAHIKEYVQSSGYAVGTDYVRLIIGNNKIVADLERYGVVEHKTKLISAIPSIPYKIDFIRGVIDGDGSLRKTYPQIRIAGNYDFLKEIGDYLQVPYDIVPDKTIFCLTVKGVETNKKLEKLLYEEATCYLPRKREIAKRSFTSPIA